MLLRDLLPDLRRVRVACAETFARRGTHAWPPVLHVPEAWRLPYQATVRDIDAGLPEDVDDAAQRVRELIAKIDQAGAG